MVSCLAVPNAFLSHKLYDLPFRNIAGSDNASPGAWRGAKRFSARDSPSLKKRGLKKARHPRKNSFILALKEFEKLYRTPGAPLEYLGKSLVYEALGDSEEEAKCLELALRKFPNHPLLPILKEHIVYRMHESSLNNREAAYRIILLAIRHIPDLLENPDTRLLIDSLEKNWEPLLFIEKSENRMTSIAIQLAFWLAKIPILVEIAQNLAKEKELDEILLGNALFCLLELEASDSLSKFAPRKPLFISSLDKPIPVQLDKGKIRTLYFLMKQALKDSQFPLFDAAAAKLKKAKIPKFDRTFFDSLEAWSALLQRKLAAAEEIFAKYPLPALNQETSPLHFVYGTWLYLTDGPQAAMRHFSLLETPYPPTTALPSHFLANRLDEKPEGTKGGWIDRAFWWEKKELHRQIDLFYRCVGKS